MSSPPSRSLCCPADKDGDDLQGQLDAIDHTIDEMNDAVNARARARMGGQGRQRRARLSASLRLDRLKMEVLREKREQDKKRWRGLEIPLDRSAGRALLSRTFATPGLRIENGELKGCRSAADKAQLTRLVIPHGVTSIDAKAFRGCTGLTEVTIPEGVTSIGQEACYNCTGLTEVAIPQG